MHNSGNLSPVTGMGGGGNSNNNTYGMTPEQASREFDSLRREATKLERHLEDRVARYQQVRNKIVALRLCSFPLSVLILSSPGAVNRFLIPPVELELIFISLCLYQK